MATRTLSDKPPLLFALPLHPPIPFPLHPTYPVQLPTRDLRQAYLDTLWPPAAAANQSEQARLESFARILLTLLADRAPPALNTLVRDLVLPLQDFDKRWRIQLPPLVEDPDSDDPNDGRAPAGVTDDEARRATDDYERWAVDEKVRLEAKREEDERRRKGKQRAVDQDAATGAHGDEHDEESSVPKPVVVRPSGWLGDKELLETRLQALLLFTLLALPASFQPDIPKKGRKKKNPEHFPDTLDAAMLLDFLTDRMQIWRVMQDVSDLAFAADVPLVEKEAKVKFVPVEERDAVQVCFRTRIDALVLSHHRLKLFPAATSQADRLAQRLEPAPSPFKARSLLSLEKSARRREVREGERRVAESPTMKRLMSMSGLTGKAKERDVGRTAAAAAAAATAAGSASSRSQGEQDGDVFKLPSKPTRRQDALGDGAAPAEAAARPRLPRKQERPRPLPRGDSSSAGIPDALKRRVVSLGKQAGSRAKSGIGAPLVKDGDGDGLKRKRKSLSHKKLTASERAAHTLTLVPDTPDKAAAAASSAASFRNPFHRTSTVPSFAALGAAFRAGASDAAPLPFSLPPPPRLGLDKDRMDWSGEGEDEDSEEDSEGDVVLGERDRRRGGAAGEAQEGGTVTPKKQTARQVLVPDT
ncbi:hypothetical protein JCM3775_001065 [Rhodotorula graminis]